MDVVLRANLAHQLVLDRGEHELALGDDVVRRDVLYVEQKRVAVAYADLLQHLLEMVVVPERKRDQVVVLAEQRRLVFWFEQVHPVVDSGHLDRLVVAQQQEQLLDQLVENRLL